jgi:hypothetical protein
MRPAKKECKKMECVDLSLEKGKLMTNSAHSKAGSEFRSGP